MQTFKHYSKILLFVILLSLPSLYGCNEMQSAQKSQHHVDNFKKQINYDEFKYNNLITYYYLNPQESQLIPSIQYFLSNDAYKKSQQVLTHFYAAAITHSNNKKQLLSNLDALLTKYTGAKQEILKNIIAESNNFISPPATSDTNFDLLWAEFMATGNEMPVKKIAYFLKTTDDKNKNNVITLGAAEWSLASNATQHDKVHTVLQDLANSSHGIMKERLQRILANSTEITKKLDPGSRECNNFVCYKKLVW